MTTLIRSWPVVQSLYYILDRLSRYDLRGIDGISFSSLRDVNPTNDNTAPSIYPNRNSQPSAAYEAQPQIQLHPQVHNYTHRETNPWWYMSFPLLSSPYLDPPPKDAFARLGLGLFESILSSFWHSSVCLSLSLSLCAVLCVCVCMCECRCLLSHPSDDNTNIMITNTNTTNHYSSNQ